MTIKAAISMTLEIDPQQWGAIFEGVTDVEMIKADFERYLVSMLKSFPAEPESVEIDWEDFARDDLVEWFQGLLGDYVTVIDDDSVDPDLYDKSENLAQPALNV